MTTQSPGWTRSSTILLILLIAAVSTGAAGIFLTVRMAQRERQMAEQARLMAEQERALAELAANEASAREERIRPLLEFIIQTMSAADPNAVSVRGFLDRAAEQRDAGTPTIDPGVEGAMRSALGRMYLETGDAPRAEKELRTALDLRSKSLGPDDPAVVIDRDALADAIKKQAE